jgi:glycosyl transferase family 87
LSTPAGWSTPGGQGASARFGGRTAPGGSGSLRPARPVLRRLLRRELLRLRDPRRLAAIALIGLSAGLALAFIYARGELAGSDARAYWAAVRIWLSGGDPYNPVAPFLPYPYAPWLLPIFAPWALLPWHVAWFVWRALNVLLLGWSAAWAYRRHPLATAVVLTALMPAIAVTLDTGNITLLLALGIWAAQFCGPRLGGAIWALTVSTKWLPVLLFVILPRRTRLWAIVWLGVAVVLSLATFPQTVTWVQTMIGFPRPPRVDYLVLLWAAIPWLWLHPQPLWWLHPREIGGRVREMRILAAVWLAGLRAHPEATAVETRHRVGSRLKSFLGAG